MHCSAQSIAYNQTGSFTKIVLDYLDQHSGLSGFYQFTPDLEGIKKAIAARRKQGTDRKVLVEELKKQYELVKPGKRTSENLRLLLEENTFTITTAHQPNLFTGPLYFIYKILHVIRLADQLKKDIPEFDFVPVFYMGSEDADLDELGNFTLEGKKFTWNTRQEGAVGRMKVDKDLLRILGEMEGQLSIHPFGKEMIARLRDFYKEGSLVQEATFRLLHALFDAYGLVILLPDNNALKRLAISIFKQELLEQVSSQKVEFAIGELEKQGYKAQAQPREINLFYLEEGSRARIIKENDHYKINGSDKSFTRQEILEELKAHPGRFSPNVILRGIYQELILPNIIFCGGGGELAYWLQFRSLFEHFRLSMPVLILRNSFLILEKRDHERMKKLGFNGEEYFLDERSLMDQYTTRHTGNRIRLNGAFEEAEKLYESIRDQSLAIDPSLGAHVEALKTRSLYRLQELEKKMLRAEKRKFGDTGRQVKQFRDTYFPGGGLQERTENFLFYYARYGEEFLKTLYQHSRALEQQFVVLELN